MNNEKYTQTNSTNEPVHCKDCQHLMFSDCYGECTRHGDYEWHGCCEKDCR